MNFFNFFHTQSLKSHNFLRIKEYRHRLGHWGENSAARLLMAKQYDILARNYRVKQGEIDIVAQDGNVIVFVEVKTRSSHLFANPSLNLKINQKKRIFRAAEHYLREIHQSNSVYRFDLIEVIIAPDSWIWFPHLQEIRHHPNFFVPHKK